MNHSMMMKIMNLITKIQESQGISKDHQDSWWYQIYREKKKWQKERRKKRREKENLTDEQIWDGLFISENNEKTHSNKINK
jgi:hypothetical protein